MQWFLCTRHFTFHQNNTIKEAVIKSEVPELPRDDQCRSCSVPRLPKEIFLIVSLQFTQLFRAFYYLPRRFLFVHHGRATIKGGKCFPAKSWPSKFNTPQTMLFTDLAWLSAICNTGMVRKPDKVLVVGFCSLFQPWSCTKHNSCVLSTGELTDRNVT